MVKSRKLKIDKNYIPALTKEGDEIYPNGMFHFNISRILDDIEAGKLVVTKERIQVDEWFRNHYRPSVNEEHLPSVDVTKAVIQAEIRPGMYNIIDGNHRMEKAKREGVEFVDSYKLQGEQIIPYFIDVTAYETFVEYWNSKLK